MNRTVHVLVAIHVAKNDATGHFNVQLAHVGLWRGEQIIDCRHGQPGHTLHEALEQAAILSDVKPEMAFVDRGYRGVEVEGVQVSGDQGSGAASRAA